jgi:hypoxanthine phosphoribosyltransferase
LQQKEIRPVHTAEEIAARVRELAEAIRTEVGTGEVFLLGVLKGSSCVLADLMRTLPGDVTYSFIDVVRDIADQTDALEIDFLSFTDIRGREVYLIKDVVTTGIIENYLLGQLRQHQPKHLRLVALLDRPDARTVDVKTDYRLFTIAEGTFVGYGLEQQGRYGNLPYIARVD